MRALRDVSAMEGQISTKDFERLPEETKEELVAMLMKMAASLNGHALEVGVSIGISTDGDLLLISTGEVEPEEMAWLLRDLADRLDAQATADAAIKPRPS